MGAQRELNALLFELQAEETPLERAKILARAWRTVRELNRVDRRLLVRNAGFEGAEQIVEGLSRRRDGLAPALLQRLLGNLRASDGVALGDVLQSLQDPARRGGLVEDGVRVAAELLREPAGDPARETAVGSEVGSRDTDEIDAAAADEARAVLHAVTDPRAGDELREVKDAIPASGDGTGAGSVASPAPAPGLARDPRAPGPPASGQTAVSSEPEGGPPRWAAAPGWATLSESTSPPTTPSNVMAVEGERRQSKMAVSTDAGMALTSLGADQSVMSRLLNLHRALETFRGSSTAILRELVHSFPDGWARRRALVELIRSGVVGSPEAAIELATSLGRELDRRWCMCLLAAREGLSGVALQQALELVDSAWARRRLARRRPGAPLSDPAGGCLRRQ